jgi:hypothetical protein
MLSGPHSKYVSHLVHGNIAPHSLDLLHEPTANFGVVVVQREASHAGLFRLSGISKR